MKIIRALTSFISGKCKTNPKNQKRKITFNHQNLSIPKENVKTWEEKSSSILCTVANPEDSTAIKDFEMPTHIHLMVVSWLPSSDMALILKSENSPEYSKASFTF